MPSDFSVARVLGLTGAILIVVDIIIFLFVFSLLIGEVLREIRGDGLPPLETPPSSFRVGAYLNLLPLSLIGWALLIASLYFFSRVYDEGRIFTYAVYSVASIVGGIVIAALLLIIGAFLLIVIIGMFFIVAAFAVFIGSIILMGYFIYKSFNLLAEKSGVHLFKVGGILMLAVAITAVISVGLFIQLTGAIVLIVAFVGLFIQLTGAIVLIVAFYTVKPPSRESAHLKIVQTPTAGSLGSDLIIT